MSQSGAASTNDNVQQIVAYRGLKAAVIILGVLIVIALGILVGGLAIKLGGHRPADSFARFTLPPGSRLVSMDVSGDRLVLHVHSIAGDEIDIVDTESGRLVGQVKSAPSPK